MTIYLMSDHCLLALLWCTCLFFSPAIFHGIVMTMLYLHWSNNSCLPLSCFRFGSTSIQLRNEKKRKYSEVVGNFFVHYKISRTDFLLVRVV